VGGIPVSEAAPYYSSWQVDEEVVFTVERSGRVIDVPITPISPPTYEIIRRLSSLIIAFVFLLVGVAVLAYKPSDRAADVFFYFCLASALMLIAGAVSYLSPPWTSNLFNFLLWIIGPITVHLHYYFPQTSQFRYRKLILTGLYTIALIGGIYHILLRFNLVGGPNLLEFNRSNSLLFLTLNLLFVVGLLIFSYQNVSTAGARGKIRIVVLGGVLSVLPVVLFTILPESILSGPIIPYTYAFLFLSIVPLTYGYAIFRHRLIEIDRHVNRGATFILVFSILAGFYLLLYSVLFKAFNISMQNQPVISTVLVLILAGVFVPIQRRAQRIVDIAFYGSWYDYRSAINEITQGLEQVTELNKLADTIGQRLVKTLRLEDACIFFRDHAGEFSVIEVAPKEALLKDYGYSIQELPRSSLSFLLNYGAVERNSLREALSEAKLSPEEQRLLNSEQVHLWVPVIGHNQVLGLFALGPKYGGDVFSGEDMDILRVVALQIGSLIENLHLLARLRGYAAELEQRVEERTEELHAAKERVEAILFSVGEGVIVMDLQGQVITVNNAFEEQSGFGVAEVVGVKLNDLVGRNGHQESGRLPELVLGNQIWGGELMALRKDGSKYDVQLTIAPIRDQEGRIIGYVGSQRDITRNKELDRLKDQFIVEVSHELRTPVTTMGLYVELLEHGNQQKREDYLSVLKRETSHMSRMIEDILDLSRLEVGRRKKVSFSSVDLNLVAEQVLAAYQPLADEVQLDFSFEPQADLPCIYGEQNQLARVINNLLSNAIRYTPSGFVKMRTYQAGNWICLEVADSGMGIDPEDVPHLFDRFYRGRNVSQSKLVGTGLGLAIVKEIVDIHDGVVELDSQVGNGSIFKVKFPSPQLNVSDNQGESTNLNI